MITSAFPPLGSSSSSYTPQCQNFLNKPHTTTREPTTITITSYDSQQKKERENLPTPRLTLSRREAFGVGSILCSNVLFWHQAQQLVALSAEEATTTTSSKCQFKVTPSGIQFCDQVIGYGPEATKGQLIKAHYVGKLENGKVFDSSYNRGKPLTFRIGIGEVIKGWDQGILGGEGIPPMLAGGKRTLKLPPELGYGMRGAGCKGGSCIIPPDSVLLFDVEFIGKA